MANVLSLDKRQQVIGLGQLGWSLRRIQEATGVRRETVSDYLKAAGIPVRLPRKQKLRRDGREAKAASRENPVTEYARRRRQSGPASICEPYREIIEEALRQGRNGMAIYQDLVGEHGFRGAYSAVRRYLWWAKGAAQAREAHPVITTAPGEEAQVDYGDGPMVRDAFGKYRRTRLFVMTLAHSRKSVRLLVWKSSTKIWAELHERAFRRLGGCPKVIVLDNLREGVLEPDIWDPKLNPLYRDMLRHYGAVALPCRVRHPDRKGKVESAIGHTQKTPLRGKRFDAIELAQQYLDNWETKWADTRIHGTTQRQVAAMFAEEKPHLAPLPLEPFRYYQYGKLLEELADATIEGNRKEHFAWLASAPLLIIDDLGMRKLPSTAAEDMLELVMRRYERASTLITSNRPVEDWGKMLGDVAAVTAMLDRLLHHAHVLTCGPRSWRTKDRLAAAGSDGSLRKKEAAG